MKTNTNNKNILHKYNLDYNGNDGKSTIRTEGKKNYGLSKNKEKNYNQRRNYEDEQL